MSKIQDLIAADVEVTIRALKALRTISHEMGEASTKLSKQLDEVDMNVREIVSKELVSNSPRVTAELQRISDRVYRLRELRNMSEFGSFEVEVNRFVEKAWEVLP
jgi:hypothetical protein